MQIVIEIPDEVKQAFDRASNQDIYGCYYDYNSTIGKAIKNGIVLPKGHGRMESAPPIIEADNLSDKYVLKAVTRGNCMICGKELTEGLFFCKECEDKASRKSEEEGEGE